MKFKVGDRVKCNGNPEGVIISLYGSMYVVRLWSGSRRVGDVVVSERDLLLEN